MPAQAWRHIREVDFSGAGTEDAIAAFAQSGDCPSAIITMEDTVAAVAIKALERQGIQVPQKCSIIGCNDLPLATLITPPLTTFSLPVCELGKTAAEMLLAWLQHGVRPESRKFCAAVDYTRIYDRLQSIVVIQRQITVSRHSQIHGGMSGYFIHSPARTYYVS